MREFSIASARERFPALKQNQVFLDNAGGSQILGDVADSIYSYLIKSNVQLGASYSIGKQSTESYSAGYTAAAKYINASPNEIVLGSSTTQLFRNLSNALSFSPGDEIVLSKLEHETNVSSWLAMAERANLTIKWWTPSSNTNLKLETSVLQGLLSERTRFVACTHVSNILGSIHDIAAIASAVHTIPGALLCVDGVSFAPHRQIDVKALGVDFYAFSWYKVYGPHIAMLYASGPILSKVSSLAHYFNPSATLDNKLGLAGANYEMVQSLTTLVKYFGENPEQAWKEIEAHEEKLQGILLGYLRAATGVTVRGELAASSKVRVPTISFTVEGRRSQDVVEEAERSSELGFRWGHFYSKRLINEVLGLGDDGIVRVSMVHYNTEEEVLRLVEVLKQIIS